jgi:hypothetical protein
MESHLGMSSTETTQSFHKAASVILLEKIDGKITVIMLKILKESESKEIRFHESFSFPGGKIADKENFGVEQVKAEQGNPLLTAARELQEECPFAFSTITNAWDFLNQKDTKTTINNGWKFYPVMTYIRPLSNELSAAMDSAIENPKICKTKGVAGISRVALSEIEDYFVNHQWSEKGLEERGRAIEVAKKAKGQADLSAYKHYDEDLKMQDLQGNEVTVASYIARGLFNDLPKIKEIANCFFVE